MKNSELLQNCEPQNEPYPQLDREKPVSTETIRRNKEIIESNFIGELRKQGFQILDEISPFPSPDPTVMFVGAQISHWKTLLDSPKINYANPQNCIRLQNSRLFYNDDDIRFCSSFRAEGAISNIHTFDKMLGFATNYLLNLGVEPARIVIKTNDKLLSMIENPNFEIHNNSEQPDYYNWTYGDRNLTGSGLTLAIKNKKNGKPYDIGNVIQIYDGGKPKAIEWGFGQETLMAAIYSEDCPIKFTDMPNSCRDLLSDKGNYKMLDGLSTVCNMIKYGVIPGKTGARKMCKECVRGTAFQASVRNMERRDILATTRSFAEYRGVSQENEELLLKQIEYYMGRANYADIICHRNNNVDTKVLSKRISLSIEAINAIKERI